MPLLVESLRAENGLFDTLAPHIDRMNRSCRRLFGSDAPDLPGALDRIRSNLGPGTWKVRVLYDSTVHRIESAPYIPKNYRRAVLLDGGTIDYSCKTADRPELDALTSRAVAAGGDTALIVKNGLVTDFSWANAAFFDGDTWWTPAEPLLEGTRRRRLLDDGLLYARDIRPTEIGDYLRISPINAMLRLDEVSLTPQDIIVETAGRQS